MSLTVPEAAGVMPWVQPLVGLIWPTPQRPNGRRVGAAWRRCGAVSRGEERRGRGRCEVGLGAEPVQHLCHPVGGVGQHRPERARVEVGDRCHGQAGGVKVGCRTRRADIYPGDHIADPQRTGGHGLHSEQLTVAADQVFGAVVDRGPQRQLQWPVPVLVLMGGEE